MNRSLRLVPRIGLAVAAVLALAPAGVRGQLMDRKIYSLTRVDRLEYAAGLPGRPVRLDAEGWIGGDYNRLWWRADGDQPTGSGGGELELQALYGRLIAPFWDAQVGIRIDTRNGDGSATRGLLAIGVEGLAPYWFEFTPTLFLGQNGDLSGQLTAEYDLLLTQRLILQPRAEVNAALQSVPGWGVGSGFTNVDAGFRLRYEIRREFAPFVGWSWFQRLGETADLVRAAGEPVARGSLVAGLKLWY